MKLFALVTFSTLVMASVSAGGSVVMAAAPTVEEDGISMILRGATSMGRQLITSDIALRLAEMVLVHVYGREYFEARSPLVISDLGDLWDIHSGDGIVAGERLQIIIAKRNARILELQNF
jgi:hypothetical protein